MKKNLLTFIFLVILSKLCFGLTFSKKENYNHAFSVDNYQNLKQDSVIIKPRFPGCEYNENPITRRNCAWQALREYIAQNLIYPEYAKKNKTEGLVRIEVLVTKDGSLTNPKIIIDIGDGCAKAAIELINKMPKWIPGTENDMIKEMHFSIPFYFSLNPNLGNKAIKKANEMPLFKECNSLATYKEKRYCSDQKMLEFIYNNLKYPKEAIENRIEGEVVINYTVAPNGFLYNFQLLRDIGGGCGEKTLKLFKTLPDFVPGKMPNGEIITVVGNMIKIKFSLKENSSLKYLDHLDNEEKSILIEIKNKEGYKIITKEEAKKLDRNYISYIDFFENEHILRKYGDAAKDGYMRIHKRGLESIVIRPNNK